jgi:hypothetical protein
MLGARPLRGQLFVPEDDVPGRAGTAVLSHGFWTRRFGGDAAIVGQSSSSTDRAIKWQACCPETFRLPREVMPTLGVAEDGEIFLPLPLPPAEPTTRTREDYNIIGKLKRGVGVQQAQAEMDALTGTATQRSLLISIRRTGASRFRSCRCSIRSSATSAEQ